MVWRSLVLIFVISASVPFYFVTAIDEQYSGTQSKLKEPPAHVPIDPRSQQSNFDTRDQQHHVPASGSEFQGRHPNLVQHHIQQPPQYHEIPLPPGVNDPHVRNSPMASQHVYASPSAGSQPMPSQVGAVPSVQPTVVQPNDPRVMDTNKDNSGFQYSTIGVHHEDRRIPHQQAEFHTESHASSFSHPQQINVDSLNAGINVDMRLDGASLSDTGRHIPSANQLHVATRLDDSNLNVDSSRSHNAIPTQTFRQSSSHPQSGSNAQDVRTADQFHGNLQSAQWVGGNHPSPFGSTNDFNHKRAPHDHQPDSAPDPYNQFRHNHEIHERHPPRQDAPPQRLLNTHHELHLDEAYIFPSVDEHRRSRSLSDDFVSMTVIVTPGIKECVFYVPISNFILDYQVIRGGLMDIGLFVKDPQGEPIAIRPPAPDATVSIKVPPHFQLRPYAICFDNRKASYADKHVSFSIDIDLNWENPSDAERAVIEALRKSSFADAQTEAMDAQYMENWRALSDRMESLFGRLRRIEHLQQKTDNFASVDKALMEANGERVLRGSLIQIFIMLAVAGIQTLLIRAFFDSNSRFYRVWFGGRSQTSARC